jgi:hypothetical protein
MVTPQDDSSKSKPWNVAEFTNLYQAGYLLSNDNRKTLGLLMPLDVYIQDPLVAEWARRRKIHGWPSARR